MGLRGGRAKAGATLRAPKGASYAPDAAIVLGWGMTEPSDTPPPAASVTPAQRALEMKRAAAAKAAPAHGAGGRKQEERAAAARSASKSKPALRK